MPSWEEQLEYWNNTCTSLGWIASPLLFGTHEFVRDHPEVAAVDPSITKSMSIGIPHPQYGIMRVTAFVTPSSSLTRLINTVHHVASFDFPPTNGLPQLYVGASTFSDRVGAHECTVLGILVFEGPAPLDVCYAPLAVANWKGKWLPYFEDANNWVMSGWDIAGRVTEIFKPFGWGCPLLGCAREETACSVCESSVKPPSGSTLPL